MCNNEILQNFIDSDNYRCFVDKLRALDVKYFTPIIIASQVEANNVINRVKIYNGDDVKMIEVFNSYVINPTRNVLASCSRFKYLKKIRYDESVIIGVSWWNAYGFVERFAAFGHWIHKDKERIATSYNRQIDVTGSRFLDHSI